MVRITIFSFIFLHAANIFISDRLRVKLAWQQWVMWVSFLFKTRLKHPPESKISCSVSYVRVVAVWLQGKIRERTAIGITNLHGSCQEAKSPINTPLRTIEGIEIKRFGALFSIETIGIVRTNKYINASGRIFAL